VGWDKKPGGRPSGIAPTDERRGLRAVAGGGKKLRAAGGGLGQVIFRRQGKLQAQGIGHLDKGFNPGIVITSLQAGDGRLASAHHFSQVPLAEVQFIPALYQVTDHGVFGVQGFKFFLPRV